jgi:hypothetical protein
VAASQAILERQPGMTRAHEVTGWFGYVTGLYDPTELKARARSLIAKILKDEYGKVDDWWGEWSYSPVPRLKYVDRGFPYLEFDIDLHIAASLHVRLSGEEVRFEFAKVLVKGAEQLKVPVVLLDAIARGDLQLLGKFKVVERDCHYVTLSVPEFGEVKLWGTLVPLWRSFFGGKDLGTALESAGLLPQGSGRLVSQGVAPAQVPSLPQPGFSEEDFMAALTNLGLKKTDARELLKEVPHSVSLEEAMRIALKNYGSEVKGA